MKFDLKNRTEKIIPSPSNLYWGTPRYALYKRYKSMQLFDYYGLYWPIGMSLEDK